MIRSHGDLGAVVQAELDPFCLAFDERRCTAHGNRTVVAKTQNRDRLLEGS